VKEYDVALSNLVTLIPALLAGVGGVLLGDRVALRIKESLAGRRRG
jgi:hypothetical protein